MGACHCIPAPAKAAVPDHLRRAISASGSNIQVLPPSSLDAVANLCAHAMCGTSTTDPERITSWVVSGNALAEFGNPERRAVFRLFAEINLDENWLRPAHALCLGAVVEGRLGAVCTLRVFQKGFLAEHGLSDELSPFCILARNLLGGTLPAVMTRRRFWQERRAIFSRLFAREGLLNVMASSHATHGRGPHQYVSLMMVEPECQGTGLCGLLMRAAGRLADAEGLPSYLETGGERNVAVYKRRGYDVVGRSRLATRSYGAFEENYNMLRKAA